MTTIDQSTDCQICYEQIEASQRIECGTCAFTYCNACILQCLRYNRFKSECPICKGPIQIADNPYVAIDILNYPEPADRAQYYAEMSELFVRLGIRLCPSCSVPIQKYEGCNRMVCTECTHVFRWIDTPQPTVTILRLLEIVIWVFAVIPTLIVCIVGACHADPYSDQWYRFITFGTILLILLVLEIIAEARMLIRVS
jgi:hypothetical protein